MIEINLLPDVKQEFVHARRMKRIIVSVMMIASMAAIGLVVFLAAIVYVGQPLAQGVSDAKIKDISSSLKNDKNLTRNLTLQNQLTVLPEVHAQKDNFAPLFDIVRSINPAEPNNVRFSKMTINALEKTVEFEGNTQDYNSIGIFRDTLKNAKVSYSVVVEGSTEERKNKQLFSEIVFSNVGIGKDDAGREMASFKVSAVYDADVFLSTAKNQRVSIPKKNTTPSSENVSLFSEAPAIKEGE